VIIADSVWWDGRLHTGVALRADHGLIPVADIPLGAARRRVPGTVLPGLCDAHVHSALVDLPTVRAGGIAAVWDLGGVPERVRELSLRDDPRLPRVRYAGPFLIPPGGYPSDRAWAPAGSWREVHSAADAAEAVAAARAAGATLIKATVHMGKPLLPAATLSALVAAAHADNLPVVVHAEGPGAVGAAYEAGADVLAHTPWTEEVDEGLIRACAARMTWISTLDIHGWGSPTPERATAVANLRRFREQGGTVRYGTDLGNGPLPPAVNPREVRALQEAGLTPGEILSAMTEPEQSELSWIPGGLRLEPDTFADVLATARVLGPEVRPRS
jgi:hypothetical protein